MKKGEWVKQRRRKMKGMGRLTKMGDRREMVDGTERRTVKTGDIRLK
jgi:hypothetical protein